jgi:hypothetical protein
MSAMSLIQSVERAVQLGIFVALGRLPSIHLKAPNYSRGSPFIAALN